jgi:mannose-1-phosphate guanylyltransferase
MISLTCERLGGVCAPEDILVVTVASQRDAIAAEIGAKVPRDNIIAEPVGRNTATTVGLAAMLLERRHGDAPFLVVPSDHLISDEQAFSAAARAAESYVKTHDCLLTFGIPPSRAETGYGYIQAGSELSSGDGVSIFEAESFHEKPPQDKAESFIKSGTCFWNSGMFFWRTRVIRWAIAQHLPELDSVLERIDRRFGTEPLEEVLKSEYSAAPAISIDCGVMERARNVVVLRGNFDWNDVGNWESIREVHARDSRGNVLVGDHIVLDGSENTVFSPDRLVAIIGVSDIVVVDGGDSILVCKRDRVQQVRDMVETLRKSGKERLI